MGWEQSVGWYAVAGSTCDSGLGLVPGCKVPNSAAAHTQAALGAGAATSRKVRGHSAQ